MMTIKYALNAAAQALVASVFLNTASNDPAPAVTYRNSTVVQPPAADTKMRELAVTRELVTVMVRDVSAARLAVADVIFPVILFTVGESEAVAASVSKL